MSERLISNIRGSVTVFCQGLISDLNLINPDLNLGYMDWESNSAIAELPDANLLGPAGIVVNDYDEQIEVVLSVAASTYTNDINLFMLWQIMDEVFDRLRPRKQIRYFDSSSLREKSVLVVTPGTLLSPMTRSENARPWRYVQAEALLVPVTE